MGKKLFLKFKFEWLYFLKKIFEKEINWDFLLLAICENLF